MSKKQIILIGSGEHCKLGVELIEFTNEFSIAIIIDTKDKIRNSKPLLSKGKLHPFTKLPLSKHPFK